MLIIGIVGLILHAIIESEIHILCPIQNGYFCHLFPFDVCDKKKFKEKS